MQNVMSQCFTVPKRMSECQRHTRFQNMVLMFFQNFYSSSDIGQLTVASDLAQCAVEKHQTFTHSVTLLVYNIIFTNHCITHAVSHKPMAWCLTDVPLICTFLRLFLLPLHQLLQYTNTPFYLNIHTLMVMHSHTLNHVISMFMIKSLVLDQTPLYFINDQNEVHDKDVYFMPTRNISRQ